MQYEAPKKNVYKFKIGEASELRFWTSGQDAYIGQIAVLKMQPEIGYSMKISMHASGVTIMKHGIQKERLRLGHRLYMGGGWEVPLQLAFIQTRELPFESVQVPTGRDVVEHAAPTRGSVRCVNVYWSPSEDTPVFPAELYVGPFKARPNGYYWLQFFSQPLDETALSLEKDIKRRASGFKFTQPHGSKLPIMSVWLNVKDKLTDPPKVIHVQLDHRDLDVEISPE